MFLRFRFDSGKVHGSALFCNSSWYRDKASQYFLRSHDRFGAEAVVEGDASARGTQDEPEHEPAVQEEEKGEEEPEKDESEDEAEGAPLPIEQEEVPDPPEPLVMPSLETYKIKSNRNQNQI